jgi:DNA-binding winged helix-turn-helix (wHTH) protein/TolB-like protein/Tfp pilus assembly protein PilF
MPSPDKHFYEFGPFRLDPQKHRLFRNGEHVHLSPKAMEALRVFVQNPGKMLERDLLMQAVWADSFVEDANLTVAVSQLRKALGQNGETAEYIETLPRIGYRFVADVRVVREAPIRIEKHTLSQTVIEEEMVEEEASIEDSIAVGSGSARRLLPASVSPGVASLLTFVIVSAVAAGAVLYSGRTQPPKPTSGTAAIAAIRSIAVLPPRSLSRDEESLPLSLGVADALITRLGSVQRLSVRPTSAVMRYVDENHDALTTGRSLEVDAILDGTLQRDANGVRVTLRLLDVTSGQQLWSGHFDEPAGDVFKLQDAVAQQVGEALFPNLSVSDKALLVRRQTTNSETYSLYLKGNYIWNKRSSDVGNSLGYFRKAVELDPNFAPAYAGMAAVHSTSENPSPEAEALIEKALKLDSGLSSAHATYGFIQMFHHWNWPATEIALDRAIELDQNSVSAHHWKGVYLSLRGRLDEAKAEMRLALELDPLSLIVMSDLGQLHYFAHEYDAAIEYCNKALALDKDFLMAHEYLADIYRVKGMDTQAANAWIKRRFSDSKSVENQKQIFAQSGLRGLIQNERDSILSSDKTAPLSAAFVIAKDFLRLGEHDKALDWLEVAFAGTRSHWHPYLSVDPLYDSVRNQPRFKALLSRMNLP